MSAANDRAILGHEAKRLHPKVADFEAFLKRVNGLKLSRAYDYLRIGVERDAAIIVEHLITFARSGQMRDDAMVFGWPKPRPPNADDFESDQALMTQWAKDRLKIAVRVDPRNDDRWRIDSETARQLGLSSDRFRH